MQLLLKSMCFQPFRLGQLGLPLVKRLKPLCLEFEGASYVQAVQGAYAEFWAVTAGQVGTDIECVFGHCAGEPQSTLAIIFKCEVDPLRVRRQNLTPRSQPQTITCSQ
jgi:hypothetical protein